jgi:hypothetical protein
MAVRALAVTLLLAPLSAQPRSPFQDLASELASTIASRLTAGEPVALLTAQLDLDDVRVVVARTLAARGFRVGDRVDAVATSVRFACFENLRERGCIAEIVTRQARDEVAVTRSLDAHEHRQPQLSIDVRPVFAQRTPILDVEVVGDRLVVLDPENLSLYRQSAAGWQRVQARPIAASHAWPRDLRGRLRVEPSGAGTVDAFLPGVFCRSTIELSSLVCADERPSWPMDIENTGLDARRNYFSTPEGLTFFNAARLDAAAGAEWLVAAPTGELLFLDEARRTIGSAASGDEAIALTTPCAAERVVAISTSPGAGRPDMLRVFRAARRQLIPAAAPVELPGALTALWASGTSRVATAVVRAESGERYDAYHIGIACDR